MHIYIDESGAFTGDTVSAVGALIVPDSRRARVEKKFATLRADLPKERGEVKGRLLSEEEVDGVVTMLARHDVLFEIVAIDTSMHTSADIATHQAEQADRLTRHLTPRHNRTVRETFFDLRRRLEGMAPQLYVQSASTFALIETVIQHATLFFAQRIPKELAAFHWVIDGKDKDRITDWENWWSYVVRPMLQSISLKKPMVVLDVGDYSFFERFQTAIKDHLRPYVPVNAQDDSMTDINRLMTESFRFSSASEPGLEIVDIVVNATRRAMLGHLGITGWRNIPKLMVRRKGHYISMVTLLTSAPRRWPTPAYAAVLQHFSDGGKVMLAPRFYRERAANR